MGGLIQTKGTQRLLNLFNNLFDKNTLGTMRTGPATNSKGLSVLSAFPDSSNDLLGISDAFIAQYATAPATWPSDKPATDLFYPSATMVLSSAVNNATTLTFNTAATLTTIPAYIAQNASVTSLDSRAGIPRGTIVSNNPSAPAAAGGSFTVTVSNKVTLRQGERITFNSQKHPQLVRRWRWYLNYDLLDQNHSEIRRAISRALSDATFTSVKFHTIEDTQRVVTTVQQQLDVNNEFDDTSFHMHILLMTQRTTSTDDLDPQY
jgi:hypothetical protein